MYLLDRVIIVRQGEFLVVSKECDLHMCDVGFAERVAFECDEVIISGKPPCFIFHDAFHAIRTRSDRFNVVVGHVKLLVRDILPDMFGNDPHCRVLEEGRVGLLDAKDDRFCIGNDDIDALPARAPRALDGKPRITHPLDGECDVLRGDRFTVVPDEIIAERESIGEPVQRYAHALRKIGNEVALWRCLKESGICECHHITIGIRFCDHRINEARPADNPFGE